MNFTDVVSKRYILTEEQIESAQISFLKSLEEDGLRIKGPFTYFIEGVNDKYRAVWFMMSVENEIVLEDGNYKFDSYYSIEKAVCCRIKVKDMVKINDIYKEMESYCLKDDKKICSPVYFVSGADGEDPYYLLKAAVSN